PACPEAYVSGSPITSYATLLNEWSDGSVKHALIAFEVASIAEDGSVQVDFRDDPTSAACATTGYWTYDDLTDGTVAWGAELEADADSVTFTRNAETMLGDCGSISTSIYADGAECRYYIRNPLVTQVIIED